MSTRSSGKEKVVSFLIEKGADVVPVTKSALGPPLHRVFRGPFTLDIVKVLVEQTPELNDLATGIPLLLEAMSNFKWSLRLMKTFLKFGACPNYGANSKVPQALFFACGLKKSEEEIKEIVSLLLENLADPNFITPYGVRAIEVAASKGLRDVVEILVPVTNKIPDLRGNWDADSVMKFVSTDDYKRTVTGGRLNYISTLILSGDQAGGIDALPLYNHAHLESRLLPNNSFLGTLALKIGEVFFRLKEYKRSAELMGGVLAILSAEGDVKPKSNLLADLAFFTARSYWSLAEHWRAEYYFQLATTFSSDEKYKKAHEKIEARLGKRAHKIARGVPN